MGHRCSNGKNVGHCFAIAEDQETASCCNILGEILQMCGLCCYITCPPLPEIITRKLAFHPPKKGLTYTVHLKELPEKKIQSIEELIGQEFDIKPKRMSPAITLDYEQTMKYVKPFIVRTSYGNHLICVKCTPRRVTTIEEFKNQVIIFAQPNSTDIGGFLQPLFVNLTHLAEIFEMDVYGFDYSGYGYSSGTPCEKNIYADIRAVYDHVKSSSPDKKVVLLGYSIGTSAVIDFASSHLTGISGVILVAPFTSGLRLIKKKPDSPDSCYFDRFRSFDKISKIDVPVLICHGTMDTVVSSEHGIALFEKLRKPVVPFIVHGADHQTILNGQHPQTFGRIYKFLRFETEVECNVLQTSPNDK